MKAVEAALSREGRRLSDYRPAHRPAGLQAAARIPGQEAQARRGDRLHGRRYSAPVGLAAGARSRQRRAARTRRHRDLRARLLRGHDQPLHAPRRQCRRPPARPGRHAHGCAGKIARRSQAKGVRPKFIYTIPTVQNPTATILGLERRKTLLELAEDYGVPIFEDDCYADLTWNGQRPPAIYAMSKAENVIHIGSFLQDNRAGAARRLHCRAVVADVAPVAAQDRCRFGRA